MKLYRSRTNKQVLGLCGGLAEVWNVDVTLLRLVVLVTAFFSAGSILLLYFLAGFVVPVEPVQVSASTYHDFSTNNFSSNKFAKDSFYHQQQQEAEMHQQQTDFEQMMGELEKKALQKEIEALKQKLAEYEKGDK